MRVAATLLIAATCLFPVFSPAESQPTRRQYVAIDDFSGWLAAYQARGRTDFSNRNEAQAIVTLAQRRWQEIKLLIKDQPERFVPLDGMRAAVPAELQPWIEHQLKGRGSFQVSCRLPEAHDHAVEQHQHGYEYEATVHGKRYKAIVFGAWKNQRSVQEANIEGTVFDDTILLGDAPTPDQQAAAGEVVLSDVPNPTGPNTLLYIIARFSDEAAEPISDSTALSRMASVNDFWLNNSGGSVSIQGLVNPDQIMDVVHVTLPRPMSYGSTYNNNFGQLLTDARAAANALGYNYNNYNLDLIVTSDQNFSYAGRALIGAQGVHLVAPNTTLRTVAHELGHNLGLFHANYWRTDSLRPFGKDSVPGGYVADVLNAEWIEYGHPFSVMAAQTGSEIDDATKPHYATAEKVALGWLSGNEVRYVSATGTNRIFRHDHRQTLGTPRAVRIESAATDYTGFGRRYWLSYRYAPWSTAQNWFRNGLQIDVVQIPYGFYGAAFLDMTPYSRDASSPFFDPNNKSSSYWTIDNNDKLDGALVIGRTYSDTAAGIHITPVAAGNNGPNEEYIDVVVNLGAFNGNSPPAITSFTTSTNETGVGQPVTFTVAAADPDGDSLGYAWEFDQLQVFSPNGLNSPAATKTWPSPGQYRVTVTVSDMKGGIASESHIIDVGSPAHERQIWGRVLWGGQPLYGARIYALIGNTLYQAWSDTDGAYVLTDLPATNSYTVRCAADGLTFTPQFSNPVSVASANAFAKDFYANEPVGGVAGYRLSGQVTYANAAVSGAEVHAGGFVTLTDGSGNYQFANFPSGTYLVTVRKENWSFSPASRTITIAGADSPSNNFSRLAPFTISGRIDGLPAGAQDPVPTAYLSNLRSASAVRQGTGQNAYWSYTLTGVPAGQYSVSVESPPYRVVPASFANPLSVTGSLANINFVASEGSVAGPVYGRITERGMPLAGATVEARVGQTVVSSGVTDSDGYYSIDNLADGSYTVTATRPGYSFSPNSVLVEWVPNEVYFVGTGPNSPPTLSAATAIPNPVPDVSSTTTLSVTANGAQPFNYSWVALSGRAPVTFSSNDSSAASSTTVSFQAPGTYVFQVRVTDANNLTATSAVNVTVAAPLSTIVVAPYEIYVPNGESTTFRADAWDQTGNRVTVTPMWALSGGGIISTAGVFLATTPGGPYSVTAATGSLSATGFVWVTESSTTPPQIVQHPQSQIVNVSSNAMFSVTATGTPPLAFQWVFNSTNPIPNATSSTLVVSNVQHSSAGFYSVVVSNGTSIVSSNAQLIVNHLPVPASPVLHRYPGSGFKVRTLALLGADPDGDSLFLHAVNSPTTRGATVTTNSGWVFYTPPAGMTNNDSFNYTVADGWGGFSIGTATILVLSNAGPSLTLTWQEIGNGSIRLTGDGIPDRTYTLEFTESLDTPNWQPLDTISADPNGRFEYVDNPPPGAASRFYRLTTY